MLFARFFSAVAIASALAASGASGAIVFSFADPGPGPDVFHFEGHAPPVLLDGVDDSGEAVTVGTEPGVIVSLEEKVFDFVIDASDDGFGVHVVPASLWVFVNVEPLIDSPSPVLVAPAYGGFAIVDPETHAPYIIGAGDFALTFAGTSGSLFASSKVVGSEFFYLAGSMLKTVLPLLDFLGPTYDASFGLANAQIDDSLINADGFLKTFVSDVSFVGSAQAVFVPSPGALVAFGFGGALVAARRRRRH